MSDKNNKPLRDQIAELDAIIDWFDQDDFDLDEALKKFDQGVELVDTIKARLHKLETKIVVLKEKFDQPEVL